MRESLASATFSREGEVLNQIYRAGPEVPGLPLPRVRMSVSVALAFAVAVLGVIGLPLTSGDPSPAALFRQPAPNPNAMAPAGSSPLAVGTRYFLLARTNEAFERAPQLGVYAPLAGSNLRFLEFVVFELAALRGGWRRALEARTVDGKYLEVTRGDDRPPSRVALMAGDGERARLPALDLDGVKLDGVVLVVSPGDTVAVVAAALAVLTETYGGQDRKMVDAHHGGGFALELARAP